MGLINFEIIKELKERFISLAAIDILLVDESEYRCYDWQPFWSDEFSLAKIDNGEGDEFIAIFGEDDCIIKGFSHESPLARYTASDLKIYEDVPKLLMERLLDPAIESEYVTFCYWKEHNGEWMKCNTKYIEDDGDTYLSNYLSLTVESHMEFIEEYYEIDLDEELEKLIHHIFANKEITDSILKQYNFEEQKQRILEELKKINYPVVI